MAAYTPLFELIRSYFIDIGYNPYFVQNFFSERNFKEILSIRLANANVVIKNKTDRNSHQTHIAVTGEAVDFFYKYREFANLGTDIVERRKISVFEDNISSLKGEGIAIKEEPTILEGEVTLGKRTQKQVQLSKRNKENSPCFNALRDCLYENDLLILLKKRSDNTILAVGIKQDYYAAIIPDYSQHYETNTFLRIPNPDSN